MLKLAKSTMFLLILAVSIFMINSTPVFYDTNNIIFENNTLKLSSMTLKQKIAQMIIVSGDFQENAIVFQKMSVGGIHIGAKNTKEEVNETVIKFKSKIPIFVAADLEGCINPFENFQEFPSFKSINSTKEAYLAGYTEGKFLKELGFNINFAPVVDMNDTIWHCRSFLGSTKDISNKANAYIKGLTDNGIIATSKHYPGKTLSTQDTHKSVSFATINEDDIIPFEDTISNNVPAIMVSHQIVDGLVNSDSKPAVVSDNVINGLRGKFTGLVITDEIRMSGIKNYYNDNDKKYIDLFKADNDIILNFDKDAREIEHMISVVEKAVNKGIINESRIDRSVIRILNAKGIKVKD